MKDFGLACASWQTKVCEEFATAAAAVDELNADLGCAGTLEFSDAVWHRPDLKVDADWCRYVLNVWVPSYRAWAAHFQPWGWRKSGSGYRSIRQPHSTAADKRGHTSNLPGPPELWVPDPMAQYRHPPQAAAGLPDPLWGGLSYFDGKVRMRAADGTIRQYKVMSERDLPYPREEAVK